MDFYQKQLKAPVQDVEIGSKWDLADHEVDRKTARAHTHTLSQDQYVCALVKLFPVQPAAKYSYACRSDLPLVQEKRNGLLVHPSAPFALFSTLGPLDNFTSKLKPAAFATNQSAQTEVGFVGRVRIMADARTSTTDMVHNSAKSLRRTRSTLEAIEGPSSALREGGGSAGES